MSVASAVSAARAATLPAAMTAVWRASKCIVVVGVISGRNRLTETLASAATRPSIGSLTTWAPGGITVRPSPSKVTVRSLASAVDAGSSASPTRASPITSERSP